MESTNTNTDKENIPTMDRRSKILLAVFAVAIITSITVSFSKFVILRDYVIEAQVDCDPSVEACFTWECDPESVEDGEMCTGNPEEDTWYYKVIRKKAMNIPLCDPAAENCEPIACMEGEPECEYVLCEEGNVDGVACSNPENFTEGSEAPEVGETGEDEAGEGMEGEEESPAGDEVSALGDSPESAAPIR